MTLAQLRALFRADATDSATPYLFSDADVATWLNEAVEEAAIRARLIYEDTDPDVCQISVTPGTVKYTLHPALYELGRVQFTPSGTTVATVVYLTDRVELDRIKPQWRHEDPDMPRYAVQDDKTLLLVPAPLQPGTLTLEGYRLPLTPMSADSDSPEINSAHHRHLVAWALYRAFSRPDAETIDPARAATAEQVFTRMFGIRQTADMRRSTRTNAPQHNKAVW